MKTHTQAIITVCLLVCLFLAGGIPVHGEIRDHQDAPGPPWIVIINSSGRYFGLTPITLVEDDWIEFHAYPGTGTRPFSYQWLKDSAVISEATRSSFGLRSLLVSDTGLYNVVIANSYGATQSSSYRLTVAARPAITQNPPGAVMLGANFSLTASTPPSYSATNGQWYLHGKPVPGATKATLSIVQAKFGDDGDYKYRCAYQNFYGPETRYGVESADYRVRVYAAFTPPMIVTQPKKQTSPAGGGAVFTVGASGTPPFAYQWRKSGVAIPAATNFFLALSNVTAGDVANYTAAVTGMSKEGRSRKAGISGVDGVPPGCGGVGPPQSRRCC